MTWVHGRDVSHWQRPAPALYAGARFVFIKASQGGLSHDPAMARHHLLAGQAGCDRGAYHFYDWSATPAANAANFLRQMAGLSWELVPVLDAEHGGAGTKAKTAAALLEFLAAVENATGVIPCVYTYASWWNASVAPDAKFLRYPLWIARYPSRYANGSVPPDTATTPPAAPWSTWVAWQYSTAGNLDRNVAKNALYPKLLRTGQPTPPDTPGDLVMDAQVKAQFDALSKQLQTILDTQPKKAAPVRGPDGKVWIITDAGRWHVPDTETLDSLIFLGQVHGYGSSGVAKVSDDFLDGIPVIDTLK